MSDNTNPPQVPVEPARRSWLERVSIVWVIPLAALVIALGVAWQTYQSRGPVIEIAFDNASGVVANETELRYRDVAVGLVERVTFTESLDKVLVRVRLDAAVEAYVDTDAQFWVVRPKISTEGIEGLDTVLTGVFIEGLWDTEPGIPGTRFAGLSEAPLSRDGRDGLRLTLRATGEAGLTENAPIVFRGIEVGRIGRAEVSEDGSTVEAEAMVFEPHDRLITDATRFWDTSGFTFQLGPNGAEIDFASIGSLISGGITFNTVVSGGRPVEDGARFSVYLDESAARASAFAVDGGQALTLTAIFEENAAGLTIDSPVDLGGIRVGRVTSVNGMVDEERFGDRRVRLAATFEVRPARLGLSEEELTPGAALAFLDQLVQDGLRARLATSSILTGGLKIELIEVPEADPASIETEAEPNPIMPTTQSDIADVTATAEGVFERISSLPVEELMQSAIGALDNVSRFMGGDDLRQVPGDLRALVGDARGLIGSEDAQALPGQLNAAAGELRTLVERLNEQEAAQRLMAAVDAVAAAGQSASAATEGVPALVERLNAVAAKAEALTLEEMVGEITALAENANAVLGTEAAKALPQAARDSLADLNAILAGLRERDVAGSAADTLAALRDAANGVSASVEGVPALVEKIDAVAAKAQTLPLEELGPELSALVRNANAVIGSDAAKALPQAARDSLAELDALLSDLRERDIAGSASETLAALRDAANGLSASVDGVPALVEKIDAVAAKAGTLPLEQLGAELSALLQNANAVVDSEAARKLPAAVNDGLDELRSLLAEIRERNVAGNAAEALTAVRDAASDLSTSLEGVPALVDRIDAVAAKAETLPLNDLAAELSALLQSADALIGTEDARKLPADLSAALGSLREVLDELREGGVVENANRTFASARQAADNISAAAQDLPALIRRAESVLGQASETLRGYDASGGVGRDVARALREVERAAEAVSSLARALERNPNSLLFGR